MKNINKKSINPVRVSALFTKQAGIIFKNSNGINLGFKMLTILAFGLIFLPFNEAAAAPTYIPGHYNADGSYTYGDFVWGDQMPINGINSNPVPVINSINPKSSEIDAGARTVTIAGRNFIPGSVARINNSVRAATFIDPSHLLLQINANDIYTYQSNGGFFITVFNGAPGGGYSNAIFFTIKNANGSASGANQINSAASNDNSDGNSGNLASSAIFGSNGILPSGLVQWLILGIFILIIVILTRKVFGAEKNYHEAPMKHA